jgi:hypothetical protein
VLGSSILTVEFHRANIGMQYGMTPYPAEACGVISCLVSPPLVLPLVSPSINTLTPISSRFIFNKPPILFRNLSRSLGLNLC